MMSWRPPKITLKWGDYFTPDADDDTKRVDATIKAHDAGLITLRTAVSRIKRTFDIENVDQFIDVLQAEKAQSVKDQQAAFASQQAATPPTPTGDKNEQQKVPPLPPR